MNDEALRAAWASAWPGAVAAWSPSILLREPKWLAAEVEAVSEGMGGQIAAIRLTDTRVLVHLGTIRDRGLEDCAHAVLAHEVGHHVYVPGNLSDHARMLAAMRPMLLGLPDTVAPMVANLYADLLINDRLHRKGVGIAEVYRKLRSGSGSAVWRVYTRTYEHLWRLNAGELAPDGVTADMDADALLIARLVRAFATDWLRAARRFASLMVPWLAEDQEQQEGSSLAQHGLSDTGDAGSGAAPDGLVEIGDEEVASGALPEEEVAGTAPKGGQGSGQAREPSAWVDLMRAVGVSTPTGELIARYYRERAGPHLIPFPSRRSQQATEPVPEGITDWQAGDPMDELDLMSSVLLSPVVVPGVTTMRRVYGEVPGSDPARRPLDLDLYIDCSGSMPNPHTSTSWLALAGTILALSALRAGGRVHVVLWSGPGQVVTTDGFQRDERKVLEVVTGFLSGCTAFPLSVLRETWEGRRPEEPPGHVVVISDDGVDTMLENDERGVAGAEVARQALERARGGGTLVLNLPARARFPAGEDLQAIGWRMHRVTAWEELVTFARRFVQETWGDAG